MNIWKHAYIYILIVYMYMYVYVYVYMCMYIYIYNMYIISVYIYILCMIFRYDVFRRKGQSPFVPMLTRRNVLPPASWAAKARQGQHDWVATVKEMRNQEQKKVYIFVYPKDHIRHAQKHQWLHWLVHPANHPLSTGHSTNGWRCHWRGTGW